MSKGKKSFLQQIDIHKFLSFVVNTGRLYFTINIVYVGSHGFVHPRVPGPWFAYLPIVLEKRPIKALVNESSFPLKNTENTPSSSAYGGEDT